LIITGRKKKPGENRVKRSFTNIIRGNEMGRDMEQAWEG
jgi:hypothetical protein